MVCAAHVTPSYLKPHVSAIYNVDGSTCQTMPYQNK